MKSKGSLSHQGGVCDRGAFLSLSPAAATLTLRVLIHGAPPFSRLAGVPIHVSECRLLHCAPLCGGFFKVDASTTNKSFTMIERLFVRLGLLEGSLSGVADIGSKDFAAGDD